MNITILGGGGFLGRRIASSLAQTGTIGGQPVSRLTLFDLAEPPPLDAPFPVATVAGDIVSPTASAIPAGTDIVFHLAAVVSAQAEADYDLGRRVNLRGTDAVVDACRRLVDAGGKPPRVVFTSSVASFSGGQSANLADDARQIPANSYGAQKAAAEVILADATRRGFMDAVSIRLPTVIVRPGRPNKAASSFFSGIIREPLLGLETELPVPDDFAAWICSPRAAVSWLLHAGALDSSDLGPDRGINPPGISVTIANLLAALETVRPGASSLVKRVPDAAIAAIVGSWPPLFTPIRARDLRFAPHGTIVDLIRGFIEDDLAATRSDRGIAPN
jgi:nucleoside-diphosphate-sugar epimerase